MKSRELEAINRVLSYHVAAVNAGDVGANLRGFTEDIVYLPPDAPPMRGKKALEALIRAGVESFAAKIEMVPEETTVAGEWAFQWGTIKGAFQSHEGGDRMSLDGKWLYIYQRQTDGTWKIARDIYNSNVPATAAVAGSAEL